LEQIEIQVLNPDCSFGLLVLENNAGFDLKHDPKYYTFDRESWEGCCDTSKSLDRFLSAKLSPVLECPVDVIICEHLPNAVTKNSSASTITAMASLAHKRLREKAFQLGSALISAIQIPDESMLDLQQPAWDQLRTWSCLRPVWADFDKKLKSYRVFVGHENFVGELSLEEYNNLSKEYHDDRL
jgi:hypothetical protein